MPVAAAGLARSAQTSPGVQPGLDPSIGGGTTVSRSASPWAQPLAGPTMTPVRTPALSRSADRQVQRSESRGATRAARSATPGSPAPRSTAPVARATYRSAEGAPTARWSTSVFQGAALARAVSRGSSEPIDASGTPLRRQASAPSEAAAGWATPLAARGSNVRRRAEARTAPKSTAPVARSQGGGGFGSDTLARLKNLQSSAAGFGEAEVARSADSAGALPNAKGMVSRAANRMLARHEEKAKRRTAAAMPVSTAPVARSGEAPAVSVTELARAISRQVADLTTITAAAPTVSRSAAKAIQRSSSAQEAQGRGADRDVGKKPDLDDFLRRAVRRVMVEESIVQSRELSFLD